MESFRKVSHTGLSLRLTFQVRCGQLLAKAVNFDMPNDNLAFSLTFSACRGAGDGECIAVASTCNSRCIRTI